MGAIPWTAIKEYANEYELEDIQRDYFFRVIAIMDQAMLKRELAKMKTKHGKK